MLLSIFLTASRAEKNIYASRRLKNDVWKWKNDYIDADVAILHECVFFSNSNIIVVLEKGKERRKI